MAIDVNYINGQANQLRLQIEDLKATRNMLEQYKVSVAQNWQATENVYIIQAVDQAIAEINALIKQIENLSNNIKSTAATIIREENAALAAARQREQARIAEQERQRAQQQAQQLQQARNNKIQIAQEKYDLVKKQYDSIKVQYEKIKAEYITSLFNGKLKNQYDAIKKMFNQVSQDLKNAQNNLDAAKRM